MGAFRATTTPFKVIDSEIRSDSFQNFPLPKNVEQVLAQIKNEVKKVLIFFANMGFCVQKNAKRNA